MTTRFMEGFMAGLKDGPRLLFAPLSGAIRGVRVGTQRALACCARAQGAEKQVRGHRQPPNSDMRS